MKKFECGNGITLTQGTGQVWAIEWPTKDGTYRGEFHCPSEEAVTQLASVIGRDITPLVRGLEKISKNLPNPFDAAGHTARAALASYTGGPK